MLQDASENIVLRATNAELGEDFHLPTREELAELRFRRYQTHRIPNRMIDTGTYEHNNRTTNMAEEIQVNNENDGDGTARTTEEPMHAPSGLNRREDTNCTGTSEVPFLHACELREYQVLSCRKMFQRASICRMKFQSVTLIADFGVS